MDEAIEKQDNDFLWVQFCRLGEMLGDGLGDEPGGEWIGKEYKRLAIILGVAKPSDFRKRRKCHSDDVRNQLLWIHTIFFGSKENGVPKETAA